MSHKRCAEAERLPPWSPMACEVVHSNWLREQAHGRTVWSSPYVTQERHCGIRRHSALLRHGDTLSVWDCVGCAEPLDVKIRPRFRKNRRGGA